MNKINKIEISLIVLTIIFYFTTIVCGFYLGFSGLEVTLGDKIFHLTFAGLSVLSSFVTFYLLLKQRYSFENQIKTGVV
jgi:hypothetical protein